MSNILSQVSGSIKNWWVFLVLGVLLILCSFWMFRTPIESFIGLAGILSALVLVSGLFSVFFALTNKDDIENFGLYLAGGVLDVIVGFILLKYPGITVLLLSLFVGFWLLFRGFNTISISFKIKKFGDNSWIWILIFGILIVIFALMAIINPLIGASYLVFLIAFSVLFLGIANISLGLRLRKVKSTLGEIKDKLS